MSVANGKKGIQLAIAMTGQIHMACRLAEVTTDAPEHIGRLEIAALVKANRIRRAKTCALIAVGVTTLLPGRHLRHPRGRDLR